MSLKVSFTDEKLVSLLKKGDEIAFKILYDRYKVQLANNLYVLFRSEDLAEDVIQETYITLWEKRESLESDKSLKSYIFTIAANKAKNIFRRSETDNNIKNQLLAFHSEEYNPILDNIYKHENLIFLENLLNKLTPQQQSVIKLSKIELKSYKEISKILGISEQTVASHIRDAHKKIKNILKSSSLLIFYLLSS